MLDDAARGLASAVRGSRPLRLEVCSPGESGPRVHTIATPYAVVGRSSRCNVPLTGERVSYRHAHVQVVGGRVACFDLFSRHGTEWEGVAGGPWLTPDCRVHVGDTWLRLLNDGWDYSSDVPSPLEIRPGGESLPAYGHLADVNLTILNRKQQGRSFPLKRMLTYIGRDARCGIACDNKRVSKVHCGLLLTPAGLWVVDLFSREGTLVDGNRTSCGHLPDGSELQVGSLRLRVTASEQSQGDSRKFNYQQIHDEYGRILRLVETGRLPHVVVDFSDVELVGSVVLGSISRFCRAANGNAALCCAGPSLLESLEVANIPRLWPHFPDRDAALKAVLSDGG